MIIQYMYILKWLLFFLILHENMLWTFISTPLAIEALLRVPTASFHRKIRKTFIALDKALF